MPYAAIYVSPLGELALASDGEALTGLRFFGQKHFPAGWARWEKRDLPVFAETARWLDVYFAGVRPDFIPPLATEGTPFQKAVWALLAEIPYGGTVTYGALAARLGGTSARAVGGAVGRNPISLIVPCHRVVGADGSLTGYAGGTERKARLLALERGEVFPMLENPRRFL